MAKRQAARFSKVADWDMLRSVVSSGTICGDCLDTIPFKDALPIHWFRLKCLPTGLCLRCLMGRRKLATFFEYFCPGREVLHDVTFDREHNNEAQIRLASSYAEPASQKHVSCPAGACEGNVVLNYLCGNHSFCLFVGSCSNPVHRGVFIVAMNGTNLLICPEEARDFTRGYNPGAPFGGEGRLDMWRISPSSARAHAHKWVVQRTLRQRVKIQAPKKRRKK
jgi:hypothetical protein